MKLAEATGRRAVLGKAEVIVQHYEIGTECGKLRHRLCDEGSVIGIKGAEGIEMIVSVEVDEPLIAGLFARIGRSDDSSAVAHRSPRPGPHLKAVFFENTHVFFQQFCVRFNE
jgi:hypothetical protein